MTIEPRPEVTSAPEPRHGGPTGGPDDAHVLDFSASVNAYGPAPAVVDAVRRTPLDAYPDPTSREVRERAAACWARPPDEIVFGAGAAELILSAALAYLRAGDAVVIAAPTFGEYARAAALLGAIVHEVHAPPPAFAIEPDAVADAVRRIRPRLVFVCAPNNPTGQLLPRAGVAAVADACAATNALLVLDQSYDAFADAPLGTPALPGHPAVLHLRSITKDHAIAGLRAAFAVAPAAVARAVERARAPWASSSLAQAAAAATFDAPAAAHALRTIRALRADRVHLQRSLAALGIPHLPTATHFLLIDAAGDAGVLAARLLAGGARVRDCTSFGLPQHIRAAARTPHENAVLLAALRATHGGSRPSHRS